MVFHHHSPYNACLGTILPGTAKHGHVVSADKTAECTEHDTPHHENTLSISDSITSTHIAKIATIGKGARGTKNQKTEAPTTKDNP